ncbi:Glucanosyltransferase-domain-containing protein [Delphinella strobiligena]|nr:Glucanosyltransferase-domain-containing protein [Delphinella strobiligena]
MKGFGIATAVAAASIFAKNVVADVDPIVIKGSKFFYKTNGTQFYMRGVAYQQDVTGNDTSASTTYSDPLADSAGCARDIPYLAKLRTNVIRVYAIDPTQNHDDCMNALADAGIYVISDLSDPSESINRDDPSWNDELYARYTSVVDALANYTNTLGFFAGNEVSNTPNTTDASAFVKAAVRDTKAYIKAKDYRTIGVGYATNDDSSIRENMADYFNCGSDQSDAIDFWGYNIYSWCGDSSYTASGYDVRTEEFSNYSVPAFFAEYGCNTVQPRTFSEVEAIYGENMTHVWSGAIVYMYFQEDNDYGLVSVSGNTVSTLSDFSYLSSRMATVSPPSQVNSASYSPTNNPQACPTVDSGSWEAEATPLPPSPNQELCSCMYNSLTCVVSSSVSEDDEGDLFSTVCGLSSTACDGIAHNATTGVYGAYSMCNSTEQLAYVLNAYYEEATGTNKASACSFKGSATTKSATSATGSCSSLIAQAGTAGTGKVTSSPTATGAGAASSGSGSAKSSSTSKGAAAGRAIPSYDFGIVGLGAYVAGAVLSGGAMLLL